MKDFSFFLVSSFFFYKKIIFNGWGGVDKREDIFSKGGVGGVRSMVGSIWNTINLPTQNPTKKQNIPRSRISLYKNRKMNRFRYNFQ